MLLTVPLQINYDSKINARRGVTIIRVMGHAPCFLLLKNKSQWRIYTCKLCELARKRVSACVPSLK